MLPFDIRHIVVCHVQKKLFTIKNSPVFLAHPVVVMRFIPPSNSSSSFEVSAIFWDCNFDDIRRNATNIWNCL